VPDEIKYDDFWKEWRTVVKGAKSDAFITGEIWNNAARWVNDGTMFDAVMNYYGFREPVLKYFSARKLSVSAFDTLLAERRALYPHRVNCAMQNLLSSHDTARILSVIQNGDEIDSDKDKKDYNRGPVSEETTKRFRIAVLFQMTYVGSPMIYYGDEIGMAGGKDPDCRRPMIWNEARQNRDILDWHKKLITIRKSHAALRTGEFKTLITDDKNNVYAFQRTEGNERIAVIFNYSPVRVESKLFTADASAMKDLLTGTSLAPVEKGLFNVSLEPYSGMILLVR
jgi:cyclomaltodextrinase / maltogenic alpha-amylase / neopullulanase